MNYITVKFTEDQANAIIYLLIHEKMNFTVLDDETKAKRAYLQRIITKLAKAKS